MDCSTIATDVDEVAQGDCMQSRRTLRRTADVLAFLVVLGAAFWFVGPTSLGGPASFVLVDGTSMEPTYRDGDLVIARTQSDYSIGDVITYEAREDASFTVIHRIVERTDAGFVTRGDNRDENDGWIAPHDAIHGVAWIHIPSGGVVIEFLRQPSTILAVLAGWLVFGSLGRREAAAGCEQETGDALAAGRDGSETTTTTRTRRTERTAARRERRLFVVFVIGGALIGLSGAVIAANASTLHVDAGVLQVFEPPVPSLGLDEQALDDPGTNEGEDGDQGEGLGSTGDGEPEDEQGDQQEGAPAEVEEPATEGSGEPTEPTEEESADGADDGTAQTSESS